MDQEVRILKKTQWLSLRRVGDYYYSHLEKANGMAVAILVVDSSRPGYTYVRFERTPCHFDGVQMTSITGGVENGDPISTAIAELKEEAGFNAERSELISLGVIRPSKVEDTVCYLYCYDTKGKEPGLAFGDGSDLEAEGYCLWTKVETALHSKCPILVTMLARYYSIGVK